MQTGPARFVDANAGNDADKGSEAKPWKTILHAFTQLSPGDTLYLRGGVYHERLITNLRGTKERAITIRSYPGELGIIDGGILQFFDSPATAWEPVKGGAKGEYRSTSAFPILSVRPDSTNLLGNFANSMIPLHGYRFLSDLRSDNHSFHQLEGSKSAQGNGLYCGPGVFLHPETRRIHVRLAPTDQPSIGEKNNYRGETDPRKLPLIIAGAGASALELRRAEHVILQDLIVRGARDATINLVGCSNITLDGVTSYGGSSALRVEGTSGLCCVNSAFRGIAAPWLWRWSLKYRSIEARIISASQWNPPARGNRDFEFAFCEFTDCVDGVFIGNVENASIHHCLLDNVSDDGFFITCRTAYDGTTPGGDFEFHHNHISRVLSAFAFGVGHGRQRTIDASGNKQMGTQTLIRNNVFDLRGPVLYQQPIEGPITTFGRVSGDHGSPAWEPIDFISNTVYMKDSPWRNYYAAAWGKAMGKGTRRRISHNIFVHERGMPGQVLPAKKVNFEARGNVHWSQEVGAAAKSEFLKKFRSSALFTETEWTDGDIYAALKSVPDNVGAGENVPVGIRGRLMLSGEANPEANSPKPKLKPFAYPPRAYSGKRVAMVLGYPAFDAPMFQFALEKTGHEVIVFERELLPAVEFKKYDCVVFLGSTVRAKMEPSGFAPGEHETILAYLKKGGKILIGRELSRQLFPGDEGRKFFEALAGSVPIIRGPIEMSTLLPDHPWIKHLGAEHVIPKGVSSSIIFSKGQNLIGNQAASRSILGSVSVGRGRLIYVGWDLSRYLPPGRKPSL